MSSNSTSSHFPAHATVHLPELSRQVEGQEVVIGRATTGVFVALPVEVDEILDDLAAGASVGEAQQLYAERHGEVPDLEDLLNHLHAKGLVAPSAADDVGEAKHHHFGWIPVRLARMVFGKVALAAYALLVVAALGAVFIEPSIVPGWRSVYFPRDTAVMLLLLMLLGLGTTLFHELGHVLAARARGVDSRFGIGNRLWFVVWETDLTGLWALPRRQRYLPILAGPLVDLISASLLVLVAAAQHSGLLSLSPRLLQVATALLFVYLMRLLWQAYFFVRTDYYYAIANFLGCKSLMADTERYLRESWARLRRKPIENRSERLPVSEQRAIRWYAGFWLLGRIAALGVLFLIQLPLFVNYLGLVGRMIGSGDPEGGSSTILPVLFFLLFFGAGLFLWIRGIVRSRRD